MLAAGSLGDRKERGPPHQKPQRDLICGHIVRVGDVLQHPAPGGARARKAAFMTEWAIGDDRNAILLAPLDRGGLDRARSQMIVRLIAGWPLPEIFRTSLRSGTSKLLTPQERILPSR